MNSITFVVDKLTPPSTPLPAHHHHHHHHHHPTTPSSSQAVVNRPDSGYFSIYSSDRDDSDSAHPPEFVLRRRQVDQPLEPSSVFDDNVRLPDHIIPPENFVMRWLRTVFSALSGLLWTLLYPFAQTFHLVKQLFVSPLRPSLVPSSPPSSSSIIPPSFPSIAVPENIPIRPSSATSSASDLSSSGTDSDAETDISTIAPTDISEASSVSSLPSLRRSPRLHAPSEKEELLALTRRRTADSLKSPTSPRTPSISSKTALTPLAITTPKTAVQLIPRPLIPSKPAQKTLVLDLDETLIHSLAKGGKLGSGHMVEVKFDKVAILYFVHKRPFVDLFLKKVSKWYDCVVFTASVQEYADPVIDWLESERKYFKARYYRQHCTVENGAYIKDLSVIEKDLGKVCILDNSPASYAWHEENAIPIEGWISDPTDNDLLHLIPFLQALRFVGDVRNLLGLRTGARPR